jgi:hypothetical protein
MGDVLPRLTGDQPLLCIGTRVTVERCSWAVLGLIAGGDRSIDSALRAAKEISHASVLVDVAIDHSYVNVVGFYTQKCTRLSAVALTPAPCVIQASAGH